MSNEVKQVPVHLLGKEYVVACRPHEHDGLVESARMLDRRMREIRDKGKVIGTERIAVMVALNLAHDLVKCTQRANSEMEERLRTMLEKIEASLAAEEFR